MSPHLVFSIAGPGVDFARSSSSSGPAGCFQRRGQFRRLQFCNPNAAAVMRAGNVLPRTIGNGQLGVMLVERDWRASPCA